MSMSGTELSAVPTDSETDIKCFSIFLSIRNSSLPMSSSNWFSCHTYSSLRPYGCHEIAFWARRWSYSNLENMSWRWLLTEGKNSRFIFIQQVSIICCFNVTKYLRFLISSWPAYGDFQIFKHVFDMSKGFVDKFIRFLNRYGFQIFQSQTALSNIQALCLNLSTVNITNGSPPRGNTRLKITAPVRAPVSDLVIVLSSSVKYSRVQSVNFALPFVFTMYLRLWSVTDSKASHWWADVEKNVRTGDPKPQNVNELTTKVACTPQNPMNDLCKPQSAFWFSSSIILWAPACYSAVTAAIICLSPALFFFYSFHYFLICRKLWLLNFTQVHLCFLIPYLMAISRGGARRGALGLRERCLQCCHNWWQSIWLRFHDW